MRVLHILHPYHASQQNILFRIISIGGHHTRAIDQVDAFHERDVLPYFCFARDGGDGADFLLTEGIDDRGLASVGVADEADGDLLAVGV